MLAASPQLYYVHEPFNPDFGAGRGICNIKFTHHQTYITEENETKYYKPIKQMLEGKYNFLAGILGSGFKKKDVIKVWCQNKEFLKYRQLHFFPLIKDPIAAMSAGWLGRRFDIDVIVMIRHPAAFVASMKRLNWTFHPERWALSQPLLIRDYLSPLEDEIKRLNDSDHDIIDYTSLMWKILYFVVLKYKEVYKDWTYLRHEDLSLDPLGQFKKLYGRLGLDFTDEVRKKIDEYSNTSNPSHSDGVEKLLKLNSKKVISNWKNALSAQEVKRIKEIVGDVSKYYYSDSDWEMDDISK